MTIYLEDMGEVNFPFEPEEQIEKLAAFVLPAQKENS